MSFSELELKKQLLEYRKAIRAMMKFYDSSEALLELFIEELSVLFENVSTGKLYEALDNPGEKPSGVTFEAYRNVTAGVYNWYIEACSNKEFKARKASIYILVELFLDYWPCKKDPSDSISAIGVYGYRIESSHRGTSYFNELTWKFNEKLIRDNSVIDGKGLPQRPSPITQFPNMLSALDGKYIGDYAVGLYDLSTLLNANKVKEIILSDIYELLSHWNYKPV